MTRRRAFLLLLCLLVLGDALFLGWRWHRDTAPNAEITYAGLDSAIIVLPASVNEPVLSLRGRQWHLRGKPLPDVDAYLRGLAKGHRLPMVSVPSLGALPGVLRSLKAHKACNILIREGGSSSWTGPLATPPHTEMLDIPALVLCGNPIGDAGFYGTLPPDGPIHVSPANSLR